jgi:hypothetical protein
VTSRSIISSSQMTRPHMRSVALILSIIEVKHPSLQLTIFVLCLCRYRCKSDIHKAYHTLTMLLGIGAIDIFAWATNVLEIRSEWIKDKSSP